MKAAISRISIPQSCHEDWHEMSQNVQGRFCNSCQKTVIDFTKLSNSEIIDILSSSKNTCGRFNDSQLNTINNALALHQSFFSWKKLSLAAAFIGFIPFIKAEAKVKPEIFQRQVSQKEIKPLNDTTIIYKKITGRITDTAKVGLAGAVIGIKEKQVYVSANINGDFSLNIPVSNKTDSLTLSIFEVGYNKMDIKIDPFKQLEYNIEMSSVNSHLSIGIVVISKPPFYRRIWHGITNPFRSNSSK